MCYRHGDGRSKIQNFVVLTVQCGYVLGYATLPLMAYLSQNWHVLLYIISVGSIVFAVGYWYFPETLQWLICKGKIENAKTLVNEIAKHNKIDFEERTETLIQKDENDEAKLKEDIYAEDSSVFAMLKNPVMRCRLIVTTFVWFVTSFVYYAITLNTSYLQGDRYINCLLAAILEIPSIGLAYWMLNKVGRVKTSVFFFFASAIPCIAAPLLEQASQTAISVMAIAGKTAISGAFYVIYIHTVEIAPTLHRNLFMNVCSAFSNIGSILSPYAMFIGKTSTSQLVIYLLMGGLSAVAGILIMIFLPETVGSPLPGTIQEAAEQKTLIQMSYCYRKRSERSKTRQR
ncbi:organic cation/carnitine transporter 2-like isoform X1 [Styela clava]